MELSLTQKTRRISVALLVFVGLLSAERSHAGYFEISGNGAYYKYNNGPVGGVDATTIVQRWGGGLAYRFLANTSIELSYSDSKNTDRYGQQDDVAGYRYDITKVTQIQNTSLDLVLDFADKKSRFRPFVRAGGGYMNRKIRMTGTRTQLEDTTDTTALTPYAVNYYSASATAGIGFKVFVADAIAIETSGNAYATDLDKSEMYIHYSAAVGLRLLF